MRRRTVVLVILLLIAFYLVYRLISKNGPKFTGKEYAKCFQRPSTNESFQEFTEDVKNIDRKIFFAETSCESNYSELNCRQACAVEAAAKMNPNTLVYLLFVSSAPASEPTRRLLRHVLGYDNVRVRRIQFERYIEASPIDEWYKPGIFERSPWPPVDMSDMLRHVTLWKFGGIYLDLDVILTKSLEDLTNFMVVEDEKHVASGMFGLTASGVGRLISEACLGDVMLNFLYFDWGHIGPALMTRVVQSLCDAEKIEDVLETNGCHGLTLLPPEAFHPYNWKEWENYFIKDNLDEAMRRIGLARGVHLWNKFSESKILRKSERVPVTLVAEKSCPQVYQYCNSAF